MQGGSEKFADLSTGTPFLNRSPPPIPRQQILGANCHVCWLAYRLQLSTSSSVAWPLMTSQMERWNATKLNSIRLRTWPTRAPNTTSIVSPMCCFRQWRNHETQSPSLRTQAASSPRRTCGRVASPSSIIDACSHRGHTHPGWCSTGIVPETPAIWLATDTKVHRAP